jgi:hypothetical protein
MAPVLPWNGCNIFRGLFYIQQISLHSYENAEISKNFLIVVYPVILQSIHVRAVARILVMGGGGQNTTFGNL